MISKYITVLGLSCLLNPAYAEVTDSADSLAPTENPHEWADEVQSSGEISCRLENDVYYIYLGSRKCHFIPQELLQRTNDPNFCPPATNPSETARQYSLLEAEARRALPANQAMERIYNRYAQGLQEGSITLDEVENGGCFHDDPVLKYLGPYHISGMTEYTHTGPLLGIQQPRELAERIIGLVKEDLMQILADRYFQGLISGATFADEDQLTNLLGSLFRSEILSRYPINSTGQQNIISALVSELSTGSINDHLNPFRPSGNNYRYRFSDYHFEGDTTRIRTFPSLSHFQSDREISEGLQSYLTEFVY